MAGEVSGAAATGGAEPFNFYDHLFPIRGKHDLGQTETNNFGGGRDDVYMHMLQAPLVKKGARVTTGQALGQVGQTGQASGCHLHFEMWSGPGWYKGGSPFDPLPQLKAWDAYS